MKPESKTKQRENLSVAMANTIIALATDQPTRDPDRKGPFIATAYFQMMIMAGRFDKATEHLNQYLKDKGLIQ